MKTKSVQQVLAPAPAQMVGDGFKVHNFFPNGHRLGTRRMSPFFLLDYNAKVNLPPSDLPRGVGVHPHRGFETVTIAYQGKVAHHDSAGNSGIIGEGDVQWMTAASGILHKEYHEETFSKKGGPFQMVQLWVNLPAKYKMSKPQYQALTKDEMGHYELPAESGTVNVIAGQFEGVKGPANTFTPIEVYDVKLKKNRSMRLSFPAQFNTGFLIVAGELVVNEKESAPENNFVLFENDGEEISITAREDSTILMLSGQPIDEPIVAYGPFLMNTQEEIRQALDDYNHGGFGYLE